MATEPKLRWFQQKNAPNSTQRGRVVIRTRSEKRFAANRFLRCIKTGNLESLLSKLNPPSVATFEVDYPESVGQELCYAAMKSSFPTHSRLQCWYLLATFRS
jgi:hypothetical protein